MKRVLLLLFVFIPITVFAQIPQPLPNTYVNDFAHVLSAEQVAALNQNIAEIEKISSVQFAIMLVNKLPKDYTIEDYTLLLSRKWHVGNNKTGLVYVAALQQHKQRMEHTSGLDSVFTQQKNLEILTAIKPAFKTKDFYGGLQILINEVNATLNIVADQTSEPQIVSHTQQTSQSATNTGNSVVGFIMVIL